MLKTPEKYIVDILTKEMDLDTQRIWIRSQNRKIPPNSDALYCVVGFLYSQPLSVKTEHKQNETTGGVTEIQTVYEKQLIQIDLFSRSTEARDRRSEVLMALQSYYSENIQNANGFRIYKIPQSFLNTSGAEGGSEINRFTITIGLQVWSQKTKDVPYYDTFRIDENLLTEN